MDRREFLRLGAIAGAGAVLSQCSGSSAKSTSSRVTSTTAPRAESVLDSAPADSGIETVVVAMMENRSFDSYFGWLARDAHYLEQGRSRYGGNFAIAGSSFQEFHKPDGTTVKTARRVLSTDATPWRGCDHPDPGHGWDDGRAQRDGGFLAKASGNDAFALSYFEGDDLPFYELLAKRFTVCDRWHASLLGPTYPNREYLLSAQSGGHKDNFLPFADGGFKWTTIIDRLAAAHVPVAEYYTDLPTSLLWGARMTPHTRKISTFAADAAAGKLPPVTFVSPAFVGGNRSDDHPHGDPRAAQKFVRDAFAAFARSPQWKRGLFVLTYDEWGGSSTTSRRPSSPTDAPTSSTKTTSRKPASACRPCSPRRTPDPDTSIARSTTTRRCCDSSSGASWARRRVARVPPATSGSSPHAIATRTISARASYAPNPIPKSGSISMSRSRRRKPRALPRPQRIRRRRRARSKSR